MPLSIRDILFQMFENIKSLRLETNLNGTIVINGLISTEGEFLQFQNEGTTANAKLFYFTIQNANANANVNRNAYQTLQTIAFV